MNQSKGRKAGEFVLHLNPGLAGARSAASCLERVGVAHTKAGAIAVDLSWIER